jgi:hypothetical protein
MEFIVAGAIRPVNMRLRDMSENGRFPTGWTMQRRTVYAQDLKSALTSLLAPPLTREATAKLIP